MWFPKFWFIIFSGWRIAHDVAWELALTFVAAAVLHKNFRKW
jgi:hypothetical protein